MTIEKILYECDCGARYATVDAVLACQNNRHGEVRRTDGVVEAVGDAPPRWLLGKHHKLAWWRDVPTHDRDGIAAYVSTGRALGGFLEAVFAGQLFRAAQNADPVNLAALGQLAKFVWEATPDACHGSPENVAAWVKLGGLAGRSRETIEALEEANRP